MKIKITADSTCDLPQEILKKYDISLAPLIIVKENQEYLDGITINPSDIFAHVNAGGNLCSTAARNAGVYSDLFGQYAGQFDGIIHISLGAGFSSSYQNACIAALDFDNVRVVDSKNLSVGQGLIVLKAVELAKNTEDLDDLKAKLDEFADKTEMSFVLDRLDYMVKGGRCSSAAALGANLLNLKPCIEVKDGKMSVVKKYRGHYEKCLTNYIRDRLNNRDDLDYSELVLVYTDVEAQTLNSVRQEIQKYDHFHHSFEAIAGCTISCHCGPGTLGIAFIKK